MGWAEVIQGEIARTIVACGPMSPLEKQAWRFADEVLPPLSDEEVGENPQRGYANYVRRSEIVSLLLALARALREGDRVEL